MSEDISKFVAGKFSPQPVRTSVPLSADHAARLRKLNDEMQGIQAWVQAITATGERRMAELTQKGRELWVEIGKAYEIDITKVNYDLDQTGEALVAKSMRF